MDSGGSGSSSSTCRSARWSSYWRRCCCWTAVDLGGVALTLLLPSAVLFGLFVLVERRSAAPLVPLRIFRSRALVGGNLITISWGLTEFGLNFIYTQYAQLALGVSAVRYGLMSAVLAASAVVASMIGQHLVTRVGPRLVAFVSLL